MELEPFARHKLIMSVLMTPDKANFSGKVHGGDIMKYMDQVAYACGAKYCGKYVVTMSVDNIVFHQSIPVGTLVTFLASVNYTGKTSMEIGIKVVTEDIKSHTVTHTNSSFFTMVALGEDGKPTPVPQLEPKTKEEIRRFEDGKRRKDEKLAKSKK